MSETLVAVQQGRAPPLLEIRLPFPHRLNCFLRLWALKFLASVAFTIDRLRSPLPRSMQLTIIKRYSCCPHLQTCIFYPPNFLSGELLPVYFVLHGGGFAVADPQHDDEFCASWAKRTGMLVIDMDYSKSPLHPFPAPVYDVAALAKAVLEDNPLPIDKSRVSIGGFSSGGNLALTACQLPELKGIVKAALGFYPIVDWGHPPDEKMARRPYKGGHDSLEQMAYWFDWGYVPAGQDRHAPLLSPYYAHKEDLPSWICIVGPQWDMLRLESQKMIHELADMNTTKDDDFEKVTYKWMLARGCSHTFTHHLGQPPQKKRKREAKCEPIYESTTS